MHTSSEMITMCITELQGVEMSSPSVAYPYNVGTKWTPFGDTVMSPSKESSIVVVVVIKKILIEIIAYFLKFRNFGQLATFRYNLPEPLACQV